MSPPAPKEAAPRDLVGPIQAAYREAVTASDAYRAVRTALRLERGTLRLGNRFVPIDRYREIAFVALGQASPSLALGAWEGLGERLTQGIIAGPTPPPSQIPFRAFELPLGLPGSPLGRRVALAIDEIASGLGPRDLLVLLLSPGALAGLSLPPAGMTDGEWNGWLERAGASGLPGVELTQLVRTLSTGPTGGSLAGRAGAGEVETLVLERGDGAARVGGGPTVPVDPSERAQARAILDRLAPAVPVPPAFRAALSLPRSSAPLRREGVVRPVTIASPAEALGGASDVLVDRRWVCRLAALTYPDAPEEAARRLLERGEEMLGELGPSLGREAPRGEGPRGLALFAGVTLGLPEGMPERPAIDQFLRAAHARLARRGSAVAVLPTSGAPSPDGREAGGWVEAGGSATIQRPFAMRSGLTDVGAIALLLLPRGGG